MTTQHIHETGQVPTRTALMTHIVNEHDDVPVDDLYTAIRKDDMALRALHDAQHPADRPAKIRFRWYLHYDEVAGLEDFLSDPPPSAGFDAVPVALAREIAETKPFYEVTVVCEYDTETKTTEILEAK
jgi:hypothetical protein